LHYQSTNGQWLDASEAIQIQLDGSAASVNAAHQVYFSANINAAEPVKLITPDNKTLKSHILGIAYYDFHKEQSVLIAELKDSVGQLLGNNQVLYADAFDGVKADVRYTNTKDGLEQDIILRERPPLPE